MQDSDNLLNSLKEARKMSLEFKAKAMQDLIIERYRSLAMITSVGFAITGVLIVISLSGHLIKNIIFAYLSLGLLIFVSLFSLGRYLYLIRDDIEDITKQIKELFGKDWGKPKESKTTKDYWPETLFVFLIISIMLFVFSFIDFQYFSMLSTIKK